MAIDIPDKPLEAPFVVPPNRQEVTGELDPDPRHADPRFPDVSWDSAHSTHGGGYVPPDYEWTSNPKQRQDDLMGEWPERH